MKLKLPHRILANAKIFIYNISNAMKIQRKIYSLILILIIVSSCKKRTIAENNVTHLKVENLSSPLGIDLPMPRFSWQLVNHKVGYSQKAFQIVVSDSPTLVPSKPQLIWNSGKILSTRNHIIYQGTKLENSKKYYWSVKLWDNDNKELTWSKIDSFQIGLLNRSDWKANWIGDQDTSNRAPYMRYVFNVEKEIKSAYAYVTSVGYYELYINGEKIGDQVLDPAPGQIEKRIWYSTFDVKSALKPKLNCIGLILGEGQGAASRSKPERFASLARKYPGMYKTPCGIAQLTIRYTDGTIENIVSDTTWTVSKGAITYNSFYGGEDYDARLETPWHTAEYNDEKWEHAIRKPVDAKLTSATFQPIKVIDEITPIKTVRKSKGVYLYDLGQNIGGWWKLKVSGKAGTTICITGAETLNNQYFPIPLTEQSELSTVFSHGLGGYYERDAKTYYTLKGDSVEIYSPRFFYSGFRYIRAEVDHPMNITNIEITGCTTHNALEQTGNFECSDTKLNQLHRNTLWSIKSILQGVPMSNPNSEKYGWTGDAHLFAEPMNMLFDAQPFWKKWLQDIKDAQELYGNGWIVSTIPNYRIDCKPTSPSWGAAYPLLVWYCYTTYGDKQIITDHYDGVKAWCSWLEQKAKNNLVKGIWADHVAPGTDADGNTLRFPVTTPVNVLVPSVYYYKTAELLSQMASILEYEADEKKYNELAGAIKDAFNEKFLDMQDTTYKVENNVPFYFPEQTCNLMPLQYHLVPNGLENKILSNVKNDILKHEGHLMTGIMGTKAMVDVLPQMGESDFFYDVITNPSHPGYGFWLSKGATTHWQHWDGTPDHNHAMFGSIENFLLCNIAGIQLPYKGENAVGYKHITIQPCVLKKLKWAKATIPSPRGEIKSAWTKESDGVCFNITIPPGATATVQLPIENENFECYEGEQLIDITHLPKWLKNAKIEHMYFTMECVSGSFRFKIKQSGRSI